MTLVAEITEAEFQKIDTHTNNELQERDYYYFALLKNGGYKVYKILFSAHQRYIALYSEQPEAPWTYTLPSWIKTIQAKKVLQLMDSEEDALAHYQKFVREVSEESGIPAEEIHQSLKEFI